MRRLITSIILFFLFSASAFTQEKVEQIDEFGSLMCDDYLSHFDQAIFQSQINPTSKIYFYIYEGKEYYQGQFRDSALGSAKAKIESVKKYISKTRGISLKNFGFLRAGFRRKMTVEIWLVPKGALPPAATPSLKRIKYRKGKAKGFCTSF